MIFHISFERNKVSDILPRVSRGGWVVQEGGGTTTLFPWNFFAPSGFSILSPPNEATEKST